MIRLPEPAGLSPPDRYSLTLLADFARLIPVADHTADVVSLEVTDRPPVFHDLRTWISAGWGIAPGDGVVQVSRATLRCVAELASAAAERGTTARDRLGRVPPAANALVAEGLERQPIVSQAAAAFRDAALAAAGRRRFQLAAPWPDGRRWAVALTHDLDVVAWWAAFTTLRFIELARKGAWRLAAHAARSALAALGQDPIGRGIRSLLDVEDGHAVRSTWFVLSGTPTWSTMRAGDLTYHPESAAVRRILAEVHGRGHAIGLHGSLATVESSEAFAAQRNRLADLVGRPVAGVRQHFLRFLPDRTPRAMRRAGFAYDASFGFPDRNGFRLGVADILPLWDAAPDAPELNEAPLAWMDRALSKYQGVEEPDAWVADALELARACREVDGLWVGVWHPNLVPALGFPGAPAAYGRLLDGLLANRPFVGTLDEIVTWRRDRRRLRIDRLAPDGRVEFAGGSVVPVEEPSR